MSTSTDVLVTMQLAQKYLYQFGCPVLMVIGSVGCILNLIVFTQKNLRKNPCSVYFIAYNISDFVYIYSSLLSLTLDVGYNFDPSSHSLVICRLRLYTSMLFNLLSPFYLILASIDRILVTSPNALTRQRSTRRFAFVCIASGTLFWVLFQSHALVLTTIIQIGPNVFLCYFQLGDYLTYIGYYSIFKEIITLSFMIVCGLWSIKNIRSMQHVRTAPDLSVSRTVAVAGTHSTSSKDRQLIFMLLMDTTIYASFSFVFAMFLMYQQITQNYIKDAEQMQIENIIRNICLFSIGIPFCINFYANLIVSKTFRKEIKKVLLCK